MKKIPCLFVRTFHGKSSFTITEEVTPGCEWVLAGEGIATRKWDGTACAVIGGVLHKRYDCKKDRKTGEYKVPPPGAVPCDAPDPETGHWPHWVPVGEGPEDQHHRAAWERDRERRWDTPLGNVMADGTYELVGPHFQGNPEVCETDRFVPHGAEPLGFCAISGIPKEGRTFERLREFLRCFQGEGIVFHHPDGRMAKIRRADFGFPWGRSPAGSGGGDKK